MTLIELFRNARHRRERTSDSYQLLHALTAMRHGCTFRFVITLGAGRGLTDGLTEPQRALGSRWKNLHRMQYCTTYRVL
jgi:hypothetical protein